MKPIYLQAVSKQTEENLGIDESEVINVAEMLNKVMGDLETKLLEELSLSWFFRRKKIAEILGNTGID